MRSNTSKITSVSLIISLIVGVFCILGTTQQANGGTIFYTPKVKTVKYSNIKKTKFGTNGKVTITWKKVPNSLKNYKVCYRFRIMQANNWKYKSYWTNVKASKMKLYKKPYKVNPADGSTYQVQIYFYNGKNMTRVTDWY